MNQKTIEEVASTLRQAATSGICCAPIREVIGIEDITTAYAIQKHNIQEQLSRGASIIGYKIGLTSPVVQEQLGVDQPDFGTLLNTMEVMHNSIIPYTMLMQPKAEVEIAFVLKSDLAKSYISTVDVLHAIDYALIAIEIVGSRIENWDIKITDTIADNASSSHFVLGHRPMPLNSFDLLHCQMSLYKNGKLVSEGQGAACLGSPINAVVWLARTMAEWGQPLQAGQVILSGALGPMVNVEKGDMLRAEIDGLGEVAIHFGSR